jgi:hypothetical protein
MPLPETLAQILFPPPSRPVPHTPSSYESTLAGLSTTYVTAIMKGQGGYKTERYIAAGERFERSQRIRGLDCVRRGRLVLAVAFVRAVECGGLYESRDKME